MSRSRKKPLTIMAALLLHLNAEAAGAEIVAVVSADNPLTSLSRIELINIFLGKTAGFPDGARAEPIDQAVGAAAHEAFYAEFAGKSPAQIKGHWSKMVFTGRGRPPRALKDGEAVKQWVAKDLNAIGYLDESLVDDSVKILNVQ